MVCVSLTIVYPACKDKTVIMRLLPTQNVPMATKFMHSVRGKAMATRVWWHDGS